MQCTHPPIDKPGLKEDAVYNKPKKECNAMQLFSFVWQKNNKTLWLGCLAIEKRSLSSGVRMHLLVRCFSQLLWLTLFSRA
jgi:hypothetical protein